MTITREKVERVWAVIREGVEIHRKKIVTENPEMTEEEVEQAMRNWFSEARPPDGPGRPISRERFKRIFGRDATAEEQQRFSLR